MDETGFSRQTSLGYQVNHLARLLAQTLRDRIAPLGVVPGQFAQLLALYEQEGLTQTELCHLVGIEQPTMASTLNRMERDGLIRRAPDLKDGRRALVRLTPRARQLRPALIAAANEVNREATRGLDETDMAALMRTLSHIIAMLEAISTDKK